MENGFALEGFLHPETPRGKCLVEAHLEIAMRYLHCYVKEQEMDVANREQLMRALNYDGGISNCAAELISVHRDVPNLEKWQQGASGREMLQFRLLSEFK